MTASPLEPDDPGAPRALLLGQATHEQMAALDARSLGHPTYRTLFTRAVAWAARRLQGDEPQ